MPNDTTSVFSNKGNKPDQRVLHGSSDGSTGEIRDDRNSGDKSRSVAASDTGAGTRQNRDSENRGDHQEDTKSKEGSNKEDKPQSITRTAEEAARRKRTLRRRRLGF